MRNEKQIQLSAVLVATLVHASVVAFLLMRALPGGSPAGRAGIANDRLVSVSLLHFDESAPTGSHSASVAPVAADVPTQFHPRTQPPTIADDRPTKPAPQSVQSGGAVNLEANAAPAMTDATVLLYRSMLEAHLLRYRHYPLDAQRDHVQGIVYLHFVIDDAGHVLDSFIAQSSGSASLDSEALASVERAQPLPPVPSGWPQQLEVTLPVSFSLN
jgi:periplasmic protein TonB